MTQAAAGSAAGGVSIPVRRLLFPLLALAGAGLCWGYSMWLFVAWFPTYLSEAWGLSMQQMGWVNTIPTLGGIAALLLGGLISDRLVQGGMAEGSARKRLACFGLLGSSGCIFLAALAPNGYVAFAFFTLNALIQTARVLNAQWARPAPDRTLLFGPFQRTNVRAIREEARRLGFAVEAADPRRRPPARRDARRAGGPRPS